MGEKYFLLFACTVCQKVSYGFEELNRDIKSCPINMINEFQHENIADMVKRTQPIDKLCSQCKTMNAAGTGVSHNVVESYTRLPLVQIISANRFNANSMNCLMWHICLIYTHT